MNIHKCIHLAQWWLHQSYTSTITAMGPAMTQQLMRGSGSEQFSQERIPWAPYLTYKHSTHVWLECCKRGSSEPHLLHYASCVLVTPLAKSTALVHVYTLPKADLVIHTHCGCTCISVIMHNARNLQSMTRHNQHLTHVQCIHTLCNRTLLPCKKMYM